MVSNITDVIDKCWSDMGVKTEPLFYDICVGLVVGLNEDSVRHRLLAELAAKHRKYRQTSQALRIPCKQEPWLSRKRIPAIVGKDPVETTPQEKMMVEAFSPFKFTFMQNKISILKVQENSLYIVTPENRYVHG